MTSDAAMREYWVTPYENEAVRLDNPSNRKQMYTCLLVYQKHSKTFNTTLHVVRALRLHHTILGFWRQRHRQHFRQDLTTSAGMDKGPGWRCCEFFGALKLWKPRFEMAFHMGGNDGLWSGHHQHEAPIFTGNWPLETVHYSDWRERVPMPIVLVRKTSYMI